jgi:hypothetical protein
MHEYPITWPRVIRVWWSFFWRMSLLSLAFGFILVAIGVVIALFSDLSTDQARSIDQSYWLQVVLFILGGAVSLIAMKLVLSKRWVEFRIALIANKPAHIDIESARLQNANSRDPVA